MSNALSGRAALVTGGAAGIGRGIADAFAAEGAAVVIADIDGDRGAATAAALSERTGSSVSAIATDVSDKAQVHRAVDTVVDRYGRLDVLVNNAWKPTGYARLENITDEQMRTGHDIGVMAAFWSMQRALPHLAAYGTGRVINIASLNGVNAHMYSVNYNAAKEALRTLTRTAAREWAPRQISCNVICPGAKSDAYHRVAQANPQMAAAMDEANPMGRIGDPLTDIGPVAVFLASDGARYLTGNTLFVDGGAHINGVQWAPQVD